MDALVALYKMSLDGVPAHERRMTEGRANLRPPFLHFNRCRRVRLEGVKIVNSPFWTVHPFLCEDVLIRGVSIRAHGHNNDGVDPEMSQRVLIEDCQFDQGDDAISVKRRIIEDLRPSSLSNLGLLPALREMAVETSALVFANKHGQAIYRLRRTSLGKLILTK